MIDAAVLARTSVVFTALLLFVGCSDGGDSAPELVRLWLSIRAQCYGVQIDVDAPANDAACAATAALQGCTAAVHADASGLELSAGGCFAPEGVDLFECTVPASLANAIRTSADVRCGCGCAENCATTPEFTVCNDEGECQTRAAQKTTGEEPENSPSHAVMRHTISTSVSTTYSGSAPTSTSTTYCGTCCDVEVDDDVQLETGSGIRELEFELLLPNDNGRCSIECRFADAFGGPVLQEYLTPGLLRVCIASPSGLTAPELLMTCEGQGGGWVDIRNVSATGEDLRPMNVPPLVVTRHN